MSINQTAKRSVTRMSDNDPENKENELDPNTQLENPTFAASCVNDGYAEQI
ncbi:hypothetical protein [Parasedimentitalea psychrophila]|uniref:Uncharacterized protein n=1 Tax=Parasedimentitalea psychrophila TaxID=2997337 RepID=A0A9Y2KXY4_9RHOB|nr:hypothetical protein [Parasedimentitalea psychrophila]WIY24355.1 hypothetical protein QPJ95_17435 [Parasedimentitalea psychrophila]